MSGKTEADSLVKNYSEAAESMELVRRNAELSVEQIQKEK